MVLKVCFYVGASLCKMCVSNIFVARTVFCMYAIHIFPQSLLAIIPLIGGVIGVVSKACVVLILEVGPPLCFVAVRGGVFSLVAGEWALRVRFDQVPLSLSGQSALKAVIAESETLTVIVNLWRTCVYVHGNSQKQSKSHPSLLCSSQITRLWYGVDWSWGSGHCGCRNQGGCAWLCGPVCLALPGPVCPRSGAKL